MEEKFLPFHHITYYLELLTKPRHEVDAYDPPPHSELASGHQEIFERFQMISRHVKMKSSDSVALYNGLILYQTPIISQDMPGESTPFYRIRDIHATHI